MTKLKSIEEKARELAEKNRLHRKTVGEFMEKWAELSECDEEIYNNSFLHENDYNGFYLVSGCRELHSPKPEFFEVNCDIRFEHALSSPELRKFVDNLPQAISEILEKMEKKSALTDERLSSLNKLLEAVNG